MAVRRIPVLLAQSMVHSPSFHHATMPPPLNMQYVRVDRANVWTMLLGTTVSACICVWLCAEVKPDPGLAYPSWLPFFALCLACLIHTPTSAAYHLFQPVPVLYRIFRAFDYSYIFLCSLFIAFALCYYPFYCSPHLTHACMIGVAIVSLANIVLAFSPAFEVRGFLCVCLFKRIFYVWYHFK